MRIYDFKLAGIAAALSALIALPLMVVAVVSGFLPDNLILDVIFNTVYFANAGLTIYMLWALRLLLHRHGFHGADLPLALSMAGSAVLAVGQVFATLAEDILSLGLVMLVFAVLMSLIMVALGIKLLPAAPLIEGPMRPFVYSLIVTGVCAATIILSPLAMFSWVVASVSLAVIFFRATEASAAGGAD